MSSSSVVHIKLPSTTAISISNANRTIPELISELQSSFRKAEFDEVKNILINREEKMKRAVETLTKKCDIMGQKHAEIAMEKLEMEDQVKQYKLECEELKEKLTRANEDLNRAKNDVRVLNDREKRDEVKLKKFRSEYEREMVEKKGVIVQQNEKIAELERQKSEAEESAKMWKEKYVKVGERVKNLEEDVGVILSANPAVAAKMEMELGSNEEAARVSDDLKNLAVRNDNPELIKAENQRRLSNFNEKIHTSPGASSTTNSPVIGANGSQATGKVEFESGDSNKIMNSSRTQCVNTGSAEVIEIDVSDDEMPTGDRTASASASKAGKNDGRSCGKKRALNSDPINSRKWGRKSSEEVTSEKPNRDSRNVPIITSDTDDSSDSDDDEILTDSYMENYIADILKRKAWGFEADMLQAIDEDDEICMNAVCALYRQQKSIFSPLVTIRGLDLVEFLIDGDQEGKLQKTVSELQQYDSKGVEKCRNFAKRHSKQLFQMYKRKQDPFFRPS